MSSHTNMYKDLHFDTYVNARDVLDSMHDIAENLGKATAADLMRLVDCQPIFADTKFFWTEPMLRHSEILQSCHGGYTLKFIDPIHELSGVKVKPDKIEPSAELGFYEILFQCRAEAEDVLADMREIANDYDFCSVTDLKDVAGLRAEHFEMRLGWTKNMLRTDIEVQWTKHGYIIDLPIPVINPNLTNNTSIKAPQRDCKKDEKHEPELVFITINRDVYEDVDDVLKSLFKNMACLPGREFHINIE